MGTRPTVIMFIVAVLSVIAAVLMSGAESIDESSGNTRTKLLGAGRLPIEKVQRITVQRGDDQQWVFERRGSEWWQVHPFEYPMNIFSIRQLIIEAQELEFVSVIEPGDEQSAGSLAALSLEPPNATVTYEWDDESIGFELGRRGIAGRAYVRVMDDPRVFVVGLGLHDRAADMDPREWRDRTVFRNVSIEAAQYRRRNGEEELVLQRDAGRWMMTEPVQTRASAAGIEELFKVLSRVEVGGYMLDQPGDLTRFGLDQPVAELEITMQRAADGDDLSRQPQTQRLLVGAPIGLGAQDRFGMIDGLDTVVRLPAAMLSELFTDVKLFAARTATGTQPEDIKRIVIRAEDSELLLERDLERWVAPRNGNREVSYRIVESLLQQLCRLPAPTVEFRQYPLDLQVATITMYGYDLKPLDTVRVAREPNEGRWALENGDNVLRIFTATMDLPLLPRDYGLETGVGAPSD